MAVHKAIRSNSLAQPSRRRTNPNPHHKAELFDDLRQLNRGYGVALAALYRLGRKKPANLHHCLPDLRNRTEELRALANRDLLRLFAGREDHDAERFGRLRTQQERRSPKSKHRQ